MVTAPGVRDPARAVSVCDLISLISRLLRERAGFDYVETHIQGGAPPQERPGLLLFLVSPETLPLLDQASREVRQRFPQVPAMAVCSGFEAADARLDVPGCDDFVMAPVRAVELMTRLLRLVQGRESTGTRTLGPFPSAFIGESTVFCAALERARRFGAVDSPVLILGETGSGKELFARAVHYGSERRGKPFVPVNCGAVPEHLFENELFGHAKGAFTDASTAEGGLLGVADGGTLFLDEVDALSLSSQVKLLRFLESFEYRPLGSATTVAVDVRVLAATNADLAEVTRQRRFRDDLYFRLNVLHLRVPPLRARGSDLVLLARHFLAEYARRYRRTGIQASEGFFDRLRAHTWPGNVRELRSVVERAVVTASSATLGPADADVPVAPGAPPPKTRDDLATQKKKAASDLERRYLSDVLSAHGGNVTRAAKAAGRDRRSFQRMMRKHGF